MGLNQNQNNPASSPMRYCGRLFCDSDLNRIRHLIVQHSTANRAHLSRLVCEQLSWRRPDGELKDMSCRVAMLRMAEDGLITLPPPRNSNGNGRPYVRRTPAAEPPPELFNLPAGKLSDLALQLVAERQQSHLWNEYIDRYHYLGYQPLPGAQIRYFARDSKRILALFGFGAAAWKIAPRDHFIGWTDPQRKRNLQLVVNNARFLILPWVQSRNLASKLLAMATRRLTDDWYNLYGYRPVLVETFVETQRFQGTCYKAANWLYLGQTQGRGKLDVHKKAQLPKKSIWVYPLITNFRRQLCC